MAVDTSGSPNKVTTNSAKDTSGYQCLLTDSKVLAPPDLNTKATEVDD